MLKDLDQISSTRRHQHNRLLIMMMLKSGLPRPFVVLLLSVVSAVGSVVVTHFNYLQTPTSWQDAQNYCRKLSPYIDLALIRVQSDVNSLNLIEYLAWTGLHRNSMAADGWAWSDGSSSLYRAWATNEPQSSEPCALLSLQTQRFYGSSCGRPSFFFCYMVDIHYNIKFQFIQLAKTWHEARTYCRENHRDLATIRYSYDRTSFLFQRDFPVWTGLHRDGEVWTWSTGSSDYRNWAEKQPGKNGNCVSISSLNKQMATQDCSTLLPYICFYDNLVLVRENKTWEEALEHCRALEVLDHTNPHRYRNYRYDLVSVQPGYDHLYVLDRIKEATTDEVWTGLRFLAGHWMWVNGVQLSHPAPPFCPAPGQHCGALSKQNATGSWEVRDCTERKNFLCYRK